MNRFALRSALFALSAAAAAARAASPVGADATFPTPLGALVSLSVPAGHELYRDSIRAALERSAADPATNAVALRPLLPSPHGESEDGRAVFSEPFRFLVAASEPFPAGSVLALSFQVCGPTMCYPPETRRFPAGAQVGGLKVESLKVEGLTVEGLQGAGEEEKGPAPETYKLPSLEDFRVVRTLAGAASGEAYLAFLRGETPRSDPLARARARGGLALVALALLFGGFLLNLTPCVLPLVPVNLALLGAGLGRASRRRGAGLGAAFGLGIAAAFGMLGLAAALGGRAFGTLQGSVVFNAAVALVFCLLAFAMLDVLHLDFSPLRNRVRRPAPTAPTASTARTGSTVSTASSPPALRAAAAAFAAGVVSALLSGACVAPVLVSALVLAADLVREGHAAGALVPFLLGLGMGAPWPLLGAGVAALPKPGAWMDRVKQLFALVFLAAACFYALRAWSLLVPAAPAEPRAGGVAWMTDEAAAAIVAEKAGAPLLVSLGADWCRECREMDRAVFSDPDVSDEIAARFPAALRLDCTATDDPAVRRVLDLLGAPGLPFSAVLSRAAPAPAPQGAPTN